MINLISTSDKITLTPTTTADLKVRVDFVRATLAGSPGLVQDATYNPDNQYTSFAAATIADILTAPIANRVIVVKGIVVFNVHATNANVVKIQVVNAGGIATLCNVPLQAGEWLVITEAGVLFVYDANGGVKTSSATGRLLKTTVLSSGTVFTTQQATTLAYVRVQAAGGGGGGCTSVASAAAGAGGGGAGGYAEKLFVVTGNTPYTYAIGAAGTGVSGAAGNNGGDTTFAVGATTVTAKGGTGAPIGTAATTLVTRAGGAGGVVSTNGDVNSGGAPGEYGVVLITATPIVASGNGGSSLFGGGGVGIVAVGNGNNATGFGAGGGGSATGASVARTGGNGTGGLIIVDEYA
jgi:hypothetical protein